jgi:hypothetical protein
MSLFFYFNRVAFLVLPFISQLPFWFLYFAFLALKRADWYEVGRYEVLVGRYEVGRYEKF